jgi:hypothetical protein
MQAPDGSPPVVLNTESLRINYIVLECKKERRLNRFVVFAERYSALSIGHPALRVKYYFFNCNAPTSLLIFLCNIHP